MKKQRPKGQIVDRSRSGGLSVSEYWVKLFQANERRHQSDARLTEQMLRAFPDRWESAILYEVNRVRQRYNRGLLTGGRRPRPQSRRYGPGLAGPPEAPPA